MNVHVLLWENTNSGDAVKYSPAAGDPMRPSRKMEEVPTVRAAGVSSEAPEGEHVEFGYGTLSESRPGSKANSISCKHNATHRS